MKFMEFLKQLFKSGSSKLVPPHGPPAKFGYRSLSRKGYKLIIDHEVGGGESYYNARLKKPSYPGGRSGVTIGIGYDLGYKTRSSIRKDWGPYVTSSQLTSLLECSGLRGGAAKTALRSIRNIYIDWEDAEEVFKSSTIPRFITNTKLAFPNVESLNPDAFSALVSIVFNRGGSVKGASRREMLNIKTCIVSDEPERDKLKFIAQEVRNMKRLWVGKGLDGLLKRRDEEAKMIAKSK